MNKIRQIIRLKQVMQRWRHSATPDDVTSGHIPIEVGPEKRRFIVPARFLNLPILISLLNQAYDEFGYKQDGVLSLPYCDADLFQLIINLLQKDQKSYGGLGIEDFVNFGIESMGSCKELAAMISSEDGLKPLLHKARA